VLVARRKIARASHTKMTQEATQWNPEIQCNAIILPAVMSTLTSRRESKPMLAQMAGNNFRLLGPTSGERLPD